jgi:hypothetical protein
MRITSTQATLHTITVVIVWSVACASVLVFPWWVPAMFLMYGIARVRYEALILALLLDAVYAPLLPIYGIYIPHTAIVAVLLYVHAYVQRRLMPE